MTRVVRRPRAEQDISDIYDWIADSSPTNADRYIQRIVSTIDNIAGMPSIGSFRLPSRPEIRAVPIGNHLVFYRTIEGGIEVIRVIHGARDWEDSQEFF